MKKFTYLEYTEAIKKSLEIAFQTKKKEFINLKESLGRVLAEDIVCKKPLPAFSNSAMDGFAVRASDQGKKLKVTHVIYAGDGYVQSIGEGECAKIMTGAMVPNNADTIVPIEEAISFDGVFVQLPDNLQSGEHYRRKGEEKDCGDILFYKSTTIDSSVIAVLASQGIVMVEVFSRLKIAVVSTGNELVEPWHEATDSQVYNSNSYAIYTLLLEHNFTPSYVGVIPDNLKDSIIFIDRLKSYDVVISTGGISMGDADFIAEAFIHNGLEVAFHGVNVKPGRPTLMGIMGETYVMAMPGNPLTALVNAYLLGIPILNKMSGSNTWYHDCIYAKNKETFHCKQDRANVVLGELKGGEFYVTKQNKYGSGMLLPITESNCVMISLGCGKIEEDSMIKIVPFGLGLKCYQSDIYNR